jgi:hypothetical protein
MLDDRSIDLLWWVMCTGATRVFIVSSFGIYGINGSIIWCDMGIYITICRIIVIIINISIGNPQVPRIGIIIPLFPLNGHL